ncbi:hypothetical protein [Streptomyces fructofermentans]|uniref:Uncharacterized protein n=1 Tax=Streptomyces fructofermentans TaxID=152141 RepID=A0A918NM47_9ACTN|nr:hypothetical protein [Streptomyces fructofermentans]GGX80041.1 hypothetical protein GCM10010515_54620 [Streptomyces fructofermentans]
MSQQELRQVLRPHLREETLKAALSGYLGAGFRRVVLGVTDRRVLLVRSSYWSISNQGLLWADPLDDLALGRRPRELHMNGSYTGNTYVRIRRADGSTFRLNPRTGFIGGSDGTHRSVEALYSSIEGRF